MSLEIYLCKRCGTMIDGNAKYCVKCYSDLHRPCPNCMVRHVGGKYRVKKEGGSSSPIDCETCMNERYILTEP